jgi:hypothetical protein
VHARGGLPSNIRAGRGCGMLRATPFWGCLGGPLAWPLTLSRAKGIYLAGVAASKLGCGRTTAVDS